jgi:hypothetical protein
VQLSEQSAGSFGGVKAAVDAASEGVWSHDAFCGPNSGTAGAAVSTRARPCPLLAHDKAAGSAAKLASEAAKTSTTTAKVIFLMSVLLRRRAAFSDSVVLRFPDLRLNPSIQIRAI